jgi:hypothetical protein
MAKSAPDVIFCADEQAVRAIQEATRTVPIVGLSSDMVAAGLVRSLARRSSRHFETVGWSGPLGLRYSARRARPP